MNSLHNMTEALRPLGCYSLGLGEIVYNELLCYSDALEEISEEITDAIRECFVTEAEDIGLSTYELMIGKERTDLTLEKRRSNVLGLINMKESDFTPGGVRRFFDLLDVNCDIIEDPQFFHLLIIPHGHEFLPDEQKYVRERAESFLPCHLSFNIEFRAFIYDMYDAKGYSWDEWDDFRMTWDEADRFEPGRAYP